MRLSRKAAHRDQPAIAEQEKLKIAQEHLVAKQVKNHGLSSESITFEEAALRSVIRGYTREAGVRNLEREIGNLCRKVARQVVNAGVRKKNGKEKAAPVSVKAATLAEMVFAPCRPENAETVTAYPSTNGAARTTRSKLALLYAPPGAAVSICRAGLPLCSTTPTIRPLRHSSRSTPPSRRRRTSGSWGSRPMTT